jgi:thiamine-phosphate pyrophosphorylase
MKAPFPKLYPILDSAIIPSKNRTQFLKRLGASLAAAGVTMLEYRNKTAPDEVVLADAAILRAEMPAPHVKLILDDRVHLVDQAGFDGVHVDAGDATPSEARKRLGPNRIVGTFGGGDALVDRVLEEPADYFAVGPVFATTTKQTTKSPIGQEGVKRLRALAGPNAVLSAVGGITIETAPAVLAAGASLVAVSAAIFRASDPGGEARRWIATLS